MLGDVEVAPAATINDPVEQIIDAVSYGVGVVMERREAALVQTLTERLTASVLEQVWQRLHETYPALSHLGTQPERLPFAKPTTALGKRTALPNPILSEAMRLLREEDVAWDDVCERLNMEPATLQNQLLRHLSEGRRST